MKLFSLLAFVTSTLAALTAEQQGFYDEMVKIYSARKQKYGYSGARLEKEVNEWSAAVSALIEEDTEWDSKVAKFNTDYAKKQ